MQRTKKLLALFSLMLWDVISVIVSVFLSFRINYNAQYESYGYWDKPMTWVPGSMDQSNVLSLIIISVGAILLLNVIFGNYKLALRHFGLNDVLKTFLTLFCFTTGFFAVGYLMNVFSTIQEKYVIVLSLLLFICLLAGRSSVKIYNEITANINVKNKAKSGKAIRTLIYGAGEAGAYFCNKAKFDKNNDFLPVVFIDDNESLKKTKLHGVTIYGGSDKLGEAIKKFNIDEVIVAIPTASKHVLKHAMDVCRENRCKIRRFGNIDDIELSNVKVTNIDIEELLRRDSVSLNMNVVRKFIEGKVVLVTGGAGSIGSEICRQVLSFGCKHLVIFDFHENGLFDIDNELSGEYKGKYNLCLGSVRDKKRLKEVFSEYSPQIVFHAAAHKHVPMMEYSPKEAVKNNVKGTINVVMASILNNVEKFILISTDKAVNPTNIMGASKRIAEMSIQLLDKMSKTDLSAVRFGNVLGSNGSVVPVFRRQIEEGGPVTVTHPDICRYFMTIPEAVQLVLEAGAIANGGEIFVLNMGEPVKIYDLACDLIKLSGYEPNVDIDIVFSGLRPGEKLFEEISMKNEDMIKTTNDKIYIVQPMEFDSPLLAQQIKDLELTANNGTVEEMFTIVRDLVPTFYHNPGVTDFPVNHSNSEEFTDKAVSE